MGFPENLSIYPVQSLKDYLARTASLKHAVANRLFFAFTKLHKCVISQTLARWIKHLMADNGITTSVFRQHSTHSALTAGMSCKRKAMSVAKFARQPIGLRNQSLTGNSTIN